MQPTVDFVSWGFPFHLFEIVFYSLNLDKLTSAFRFEGYKGGEVSTWQNKDFNGK